MEVFHASTVLIDTPDIYHSRQYLDFGPGFYVTTMYDQAEKYANRFIRRGKAAFINVYDMDIELSRWNPLTFHKYDEDWLDFVTECRVGHILGDYDIIIGGIADDKVFRTIDLYFAGDISKQECLKRLIYEKPNYQICIRSQAVLDNCLTFKQSIPL